MKRVRRVFEYVGYRFLTLVVPLLPRFLLVVVGQGFGILYWALSPRTRRVGRENLKCFLPGHRHRTWLLIRSVQTQAVAILDAIWTARVSLRRIHGCMEIPEEDDRRMRDARAEGRGVVVATAHYGSWEMFNIAGDAVGFGDATVVTRPIANAWIDRHLQRVRAHTGSEVVSREGALLRFVSALRRGRLACSVIDIAIVPEEGGIFADFMGVPAITAPALAMLAVRRRAPLVLALARPLLGGLRYRVEVTRIEVDTKPDDRAAEVLRVTERLNAALAERVRACPHAWIWSYKRWKWRPGETSSELFPNYSLWAEKLW